jgi:hypothetical protein
MANSANATRLPLRMVAINGIIKTSTISHQAVDNVVEDKFGMEKMARNSMSFDQFRRNSSLEYSMSVAGSIK